MWLQFILEPQSHQPLSSWSPPSPWPRPAAGVQVGEEQKEGGVRGRDSYFVQFGYLRQRDRLAEDVACVLFLELLQGFAEEDEERGQLHLHGDLLDLDLTHRKARSASPRPVPWKRSEGMVAAGLGNCLPSPLPTAGYTHSGLLSIRPHLVKLSLTTPAFFFLELPVPATHVT